MTPEELKEIGDTVSDPLWCGSGRSQDIIIALLTHIRELENRVKSALENGREGY